jgi:predicted RNase H-like HicB family nuclease
MSTSREYEVALTLQAEGGFSVAVPALPGCTSQGETRDEALSMIREAIAIHIESLVAHGDPFPSRSRSSESPPPRDTTAPGRHAVPSGTKWCAGLLPE